MSEIFEAVVVAVEYREVRSLLDRETFSIQTQITSIDVGITGVHRIADRNAPMMPEAIEHLAERLSGLGPSAALFYDNRIGLRRSVVYISGIPVRSYGSETEIWVPLDINGEPIITSDSLILSQLDPGEEYEVIESAIDQALKDILGSASLVTSETLKSLFC